MNITTRKPNFFIIGAPKCGTTSLAYWLSEHPQIYFSPVKEPFFFSSDVFQNFSSWEEYLGLFADANEDHRAIGEGSTHYLFSRVAVQRIEEAFEDPKYVVVVRDPVDMAYAFHQQQIYGLNENIKDFEKAWRLSPERRAGKQVPPSCQSPMLLDYQNFCLVGEQIERLYAVVPKGRVLILKLDDFRVDSQKEYLKVLRFLNLEDDGRQNFQVYNQAKRWRHKWQGRIVRGLSKFINEIKYKRQTLPRKSLGVVDFLKQKTLINDQRPKLTPAFEFELRAFYRDDVSLLSHLLNEDLLNFWHYNDE